MSEQVFLDKNLESSGFWRTFGAMIVQPRRAVAALENDSHALRKGMWALLFVLGGYTLILAIFIMRDYPAASPAVLPVSVDELYRWEIWYQGPVFFFTTMATAGLLVLCARAVGVTADYFLAFARISFASTVPFALTVMFVEAIVALLVLFNLVQPMPTLDWLKGDGSWFANTYQIISVVWVITLFVIVTRQTIKRNWGIVILVSILAIVFYAVPVALFIR